MKKLLFPILFLLILFILFVGNVKHSEHYENYKFFKSYYGLKYYSLDYKYTEEEYNAVQPLIETAKEVFTCSVEKANSYKDIGALSRYCSYYDEDELHFELVTAKINGDTGFMWIIHSNQKYENTDILAYWKIEKMGGSWTVTDITEAP